MNAVSSHGYSPSEMKRATVCLGESGLSRLTDDHDESWEPGQTHTCYLHLGAQSVDSPQIGQARPNQNKSRRSFCVKMSKGPMRNDTDRVFLLFVFVLAWFPVADKIMQSAILHQSREDKDEANRYNEIHRCDIGDLGERLPGNGAEGSHCQDSGDSWRKAG